MIVCLSLQIRRIWLLWFVIWVIEKNKYYAWQVKFHCLSLISYSQICHHFNKFPSPFPLFQLFFFCWSDLFFIFFFFLPRPCTQPHHHVVFDKYCSVVSWDQGKWHQQSWQIAKKKQKKQRNTIWKLHEVPFFFSPTTIFKFGVSFNSFCCYCIFQCC